MAYSNKEYFDILLAYGACNYNAVVLAEEYGARFSNQRHLDYHVILKLVN
jgi:hypothetical protein